MTVKVIGENENKLKRTTCSHCAAILEYALVDTETKVIRDYGGGSDTYRFLTCPRCKEKVSVPM